MGTVTEKRRWPLATVWLTFGIVGLLASLVLTVDRFRLLEDPQTELFCDLSPFVACGPVMTSASGNLFGFPNPLLGVVGFAVVVTSGAAVLAGARFARWYWLGMQIGLTLAGIFITWLQIQSIYVVESLCIWCMTVWAATIPLIVLTTIDALDRNRIGFGRRFGAWMHNFRWTIIALWFLVVIAAIAAKFYRQFALLWFGVSI